MSKQSQSFRVGRVQAYPRGKIWYLCYFEQGKRRRPRVGPEKDAARQLAAQINAQLEVGAPAALSFEPISVPELRRRWLDHHEQVLRSSLQTICRYRTATDHLLRFLEKRPVRHASHFQPNHAHEFVQYLRLIEVSPNGHANTAKRGLLDKGLRYVLECCRTLFNFAAKRRHLSPYAENPFRTLELERIPIENAKPITLLTADEERQFLESCDDWQFPLFLTLMLTGIRLGELTHLLLPGDLDLEAGLLRVRNKPKLGWQVKTRNERDIPLVAPLVAVLQEHLGDRRHGPVFRRRRWQDTPGSFAQTDLSILEREVERRIAEHAHADGPLNRNARAQITRTIWRDIGAIKEDRLRVEFLRLTQTLGAKPLTAPKLLRHQFATALQDGRVDPLIRNELMGHVAPGDRSAGHGLAMTAVYTHTRPETRRQQLEAALAGGAALQVARAWLARRRNGLDLIQRTIAS